MIFHLRSKFRINWPICRRGIAKNGFQYGVRQPSWICKISIFLSEVHSRNGNLHLRTKFDRNRIIHSWDMEITLFSKWQLSAILSFRKLQFWSRDLYEHVILHFRSKFGINRPIIRRYIAKKRFSIWCLSTILNLKNIYFFVNCPSWEFKCASAYQMWSKSDNWR